MNQSLPAPLRFGAYGRPYVTRAWLDSCSLGTRRKVLETRLSSSAWMHSWVMLPLRPVLPPVQKPGVMDSLLGAPILLPLPPRASSSLRGCHAPPHAGEALLIRWKDGSKEVELSVSPPDTAPCISAGVSLSEWMTLLFLWYYSKGCAVYQECFLIT